MGKHAYLIMAHNQKNMLQSLIECLDYKENDIYVHLDRKWEDIEINDIYKFATESKIFILKERIDVKWGTYSQIECELLLLQEAAPGHYQYYHLMSGMDLPLKTQEEIHSFFDERNGTEFIHFDGKEIDTQTYKRVSKYNFIITKNKNLISRILYNLLMGLQLCVDRAKKYNVVFYKGANWFSITDALAQYVVEKSAWIKEVFQYARCGDEMFLQTLVINSKFKESLVNNNFCDNYETIQYCIDWNRGSPYVFKKEDISLLKDSNMCFARKFDMNIDDQIVSLIKNNVGVNK